MNIFKYGGLLALILIASSCGDDIPSQLESAYAELPDVVDFNFHVKPILSDKCFACHGPDENKRKAGLRLDIEKDAFASLTSGDGKAFARHRASKSQSILRMLSEDPEYMMPPPESHLEMSNKEIATIHKWIEQGADWKGHWSFIKPTAQTISKELPEEWIATNDIDPFIYDQIKANQLQPKSEADKERLIRRVSMDLTGLPPSVQDIDRFLNDDEPGAYERLVDLLMASESFGERMAMDWMDVSRYADSHGLHADGWRMMWPWRDWVIDAFNNDMPYDQFVTEQLAGDLLPNATKEQKLATAFHRNHTMTAEGGAIDEEWRLSYVFDRTETTATAFLGMTLGCAKCHDHKYDPLSQKEYYEMSAFFNNVRELGMTGDDGNYGPTMLYTRDEDDEKVASLAELIQQKEKDLEEIELTTETSNIRNYIEGLSLQNPPQGRVAHFPLDTEKITTKDKRKFKVYDGNTKSVSPIESGLAEGKIGKAFLLEEDFTEISFHDIGRYEYTDAFTVGMWINTYQRNPKKTQTIIGNTGDKNNFWRGWNIYLDSLNRVSASLIHSKPHNMIHISTVDSIEVNQWKHIALSYTGSGKAKDLKLFIDGEEKEIVIHYDRLYKSIYPITAGSHLRDDNRRLRVGKSGRNFTGENGIFHGKFDDFQFYDRRLAPIEIKSFAGLDGDASSEDLNILTQFQDPNYQEHLSVLKQLRIDKLNFMNDLPEVMVMEEEPSARKTYAYARGEYQSPTYEVTANTPSSILSFSNTYEKNRLGLAKWIVDPDNPLTSRVAVNRFWQIIFGRGLVATPQDFGLQGSNPSHPALLDHLAVSFVESGWNIKTLIKKMVMSATYRQSSIMDDADREIDPSNIYLSRGPSYRWPAELIRDNALVASGLLKPQLGGESVKPYQPEGLWIEKGNFSARLLKYKPTGGDSLHRRSMYTFVKRTSPHPMMTTFDAPNREVCTVTRENTNTPLQSLVLMNDPQFVEASKALAQRMQKEGGRELNNQLQYAFRSATSRHPKTEEIEVLKSLYEDQYQRFSKKPKEAEKLLAVGDFILESSLDKIQTAALTMVANALLNHDETYMKR